MRLRILHDRDKFCSPSCAKQNDRLRTLATVASDLGRRECLEVRTLKPGKSGFSSQHSKTWIIDDAIYVGGSANFTGQSEDNCEEIVVSRLAEAVLRGRKAFEAAWARSQEVPFEELLSLPERRASRSRSLGRSLSHSAAREQPALEA